MHKVSQHCLEFQTVGIKLNDYIRNSLNELCYRDTMKYNVPVKRMRNISKTDM